MADDLVPLIDGGTTFRVSSTLDKSVSKKNLADGNVETCWSSQQGLPQYIQVAFERLVIPKRISLVFQGGFVGTHCSVQIPVTLESTKEWQLFTDIYPEDVNRRQAFDLQPINPGLMAHGTRAIKLVFEKSSDFFGRITVYDLKIDGVVA